MQADINKAIVFAYFSGNVTPDLKRHLHQWLQSNEQNHELYYQWLEEWLHQNPRHSFGTDEADADFAQLRRKITVLPADIPVADQGGPVKPLWRHWSRVAAVGVLLVVAISLYFYLRLDQEYIIHQTAFGQTKTVRLPDRSTVQLNANSQLKYSRWPGKGPREVFLRGEAFFSVMHTASHQKFIVHSPDMDVEVLGTEFNVSNRRGTTQVMLRTGKVRLHLESEPAIKEIVMAPGDLVKYAQATRSLTRSKTDADLHTAWRMGELVLNKTTLREIVQLLEDNYGLKVTLGEKELESQTFTATLPAGDPEVVLKAVAKSFGLQLQRRGNGVVLARK
jgi:ferric-dicitrate binding protein FerR (iron transport regulator)